MKKILISAIASISSMANNLREGVKQKQYKRTHTKVNVGSGFWAYVQTTSQSGNIYTKLVPRDNSNLLPKGSLRRTHL